MAFFNFEFTELNVILYWLALSDVERPQARRIYSLSYFHLGTYYTLIGLLSSVVALFFRRKGGFADVTRAFYPWIPSVCVLSWFFLLSKVWNSITFGAWAFDELWITSFWQVSRCRSKSFFGTCLLHLLHWRIWLKSDGSCWLSRLEELLRFGLSSCTLKLDYRPTDRIYPEN